MSLTLDPYDYVAQRILAAHPAPDLRGITLLLPNYHAAQPLAQALRRAAQVPTLLLPQMVTLNTWAQGVVLDAPLVSDRQRSAQLYQHLRKQSWFEHTDLWGMTQELLGLFDELTHALHGLPCDADTFSAAVEQAYQAKRNSVLQLEARLVFELWHAMLSGDGLDGARAYQMRLGVLAQQAKRPLYVLRTSDWEPVEQRFLDEYAARAPVTVFDLRDIKTYSGSAGEGLRFFAATSLEQEAAAAAMQVRLWLAEGKSDIAIVAQDRVAARRLRALLERANVLVADETGWNFSTLSVSTVLDRWLTVLQNDFYHHDLLDLLKSPFLFADMTADAHKSVVYRLEQRLRERNVVAGLENFIALAAHETAVHEALVRMRQAAASLPKNQKKTLAQWLVALQESLAILGIDQGLRQDEAGLQLLAALDQWQQELKMDNGRYLFAEWRRWLAQQLDTTTFRDSSIISSVCFTHLAATRWRKFDAVLLLGCDANHLPALSDGGRWFNDAVRAALGLSTLATHAKRQQDDLHALLKLNDCVLVTWQKEQNGEARLLSPFLQRLCNKNRSVQDLSDRTLLGLLAAEAAYEVSLPQSVRPAPSVAKAKVPTRLSISAYNSLVACPYQFYARYILHLNELDEVREAMEKRDYGERVHAILQRFHEYHPRMSGHDPAEMEATLRRISMDVFSDLLAQDFTAWAWLARWLKSLPAYIAWQIENETQGWHQAAAELSFDYPLDGVTLRGRIDRLDMRNGAKRVLDYKMQSEQILRHKLREPGEDVQLACYAYAHEAVEAAFVSIEDGKVKTVAPQQELTQLAQRNAERLTEVMAALRNGAGLPANGIDAVCKYCEMRGLCRKGTWL